MKNIFYKNTPHKNKTLYLKGNSLKYKRLRTGILIMEMYEWVRLIIALAVAAVIILATFNQSLSKKKIFSTKMIAATGVLTAIEIVLQILGNFITIGPVSINLSLIPIALGAILYGPICGAFLGFINGLTVVFAPSTLAIFMPINPLATILLCLLKSTLAGLIAGLVYLPFRKKNQFIGSIISSMLVPIVNTGLFAIGCLLFFRSFLESVAIGFPNIYAALFLAIIGWNFVFEFLINSILSPGLTRIVRVVEKKRRLS